MVISWSTYRSQCKTRLSGLCRSLFHSRRKVRLRLIATSVELAETCHQLKQSELRQRKLEAENENLRQQCDQLSQQLSQQARDVQTELPLDEPQSGQQFGPRMIELSINLASAIGIRTCVRVMKITFNWLKLTYRLPAKDTIRGWMQRLGVARMRKTGKLKDGIWLVDETVQSGQEKVLSIVGVERERFEKIGRPLAQKDLAVLAVLPATTWKTEDVAEVYNQLSKTHGFPRAIVTDGAKNLREPISTLKNKGKKILALRDIKHLLANALEAQIAYSPAFQKYTESVRQTISAVQQTELAHFAPPSFNRRSRFMNLQKHIKWFRMILWHWRHPKSKAREGISPERMKEKLGWVSRFGLAVQKWEACQNVVSGCLKFSNTHGIYRGASKDMRAKIQALATCSNSKAILKVAIEYFQQCEKSLGKDERLPISTEVLESSFGSYKRLERHHSKGGFTTLLPVFATLLKPTTAREVASAFKTVRVKDVQAWLGSHILGTVTARKLKAFREVHSSKQKTAVPAAA